MGTKSRFISVFILATPFLAACDHGAADHERAAHVSGAPLVNISSQSTPDEALELARSLQASGASAAAVSVLASAHRRFPNDTMILSAYGRQAALAGQDALAARLLDKAVKADPSDWRALSAMAVINERSGRADLAQQAFREAQALSGSGAASLNNLGMSYLLDGRAKEAAVFFREALVAPDLRKNHAARIRRNLAVAVAVEGDFELAERLAGAPLPRNLKNADGIVIAAYMGMASPRKGSNDGWQARLADASSVQTSGFAQ